MTHEAPRAGSYQSATANGPDRTARPRKDQPVTGEEPVTRHPVASDLNATPEAGLGPAGDTASEDLPRSGRGRRTAYVTRLRMLGQSYFAVVALFALVIAGSQLSSGFLTSGNLSDLLSSNAPVGYVCIGMTFVILSGLFDLSVGGTYALAAVVAATQTNEHGAVIGIVAGLVVGAAAGLINGALIGGIGINSFIATLGTGSVFSGLAYIYSHNEGITVTSTAFGKLGTADLIGVPVSVWLLLLLLLVGVFVLRWTVYGRNVFAVGGNFEAARLGGIRVGLMQTSTLVLVGVMAALAGIAFTSQLGEGQADVGSDIPLTAIAIVVIGGTSLFGGEGGLGRTVIGFLLISILNNVFNLLALNSSLEVIVEGAVLILAVSLTVTSTANIAALWRRLAGFSRGRRSLP
jgi:ribose transport system permease protein